MAGERRGEVVAAKLQPARLQNLDRVLSLRGMRDGNLFVAHQRAGGRDGSHFDEEYDARLRIEVTISIAVVAVLHRDGHVVPDEAGLAEILAVQRQLNAANVRSGVVTRNLRLRRGWSEYCDQEMRHALCVGGGDRDDIVVQFPFI